MTRSVLLVSRYDGSLIVMVSLDGQRKLTIGRSRRCDLTLVASSISRRHALLCRHDGRWFLTDTASTNGAEITDASMTCGSLMSRGWARIGPAFLWLAAGRVGPDPRRVWRRPAATSTGRLVVVGQIQATAPARRPRRTHATSAPPRRPRGSRRGNRPLGGGCHPAVAATWVLGAIQRERQ